MKVPFPSVQPEKPLATSETLGDGTVTLTGVAKVEQFKASVTRPVNVVVVVRFCSSNRAHVPLLEVGGILKLVPSESVKLRGGCPPVEQRMRVAFPPQVVEQLPSHVKVAARP